MLHFLDVLILLAAAFVCYWPMTRKPLSEDDGVWLYQAAFQDRGVRPFEGLYFPMGYFNVQWLYGTVARCIPLRTTRDYQAVKVAWYAATALSVYGLGLVLFPERQAALLGAGLFILATAMPNTLFMFTYAEHFFQLPVNLCLMFAGLGLSGGGWPFFVLAGLCGAWAVQMKIVTLAVVAPVFVASWFAPSALLSALAYVCGFVLLTALPLAFIRDPRGKRYYVHGLVGPMWQAASFYASRGRHWLSEIRQLLGKKGSLVTGWRKTGGKGEPGNAGSEADTSGTKASEKSASETESAFETGADVGNAYVTHMLAGVGPSRLGRLRENVLPAMGQTYAVVLLALAQLPLLFVSVQPQVVLLMALALAYLCVQFVQNNYHTPHFNPVWTPLALLAGATLHNMLPECATAPWLAAAAGVLLGSNLLLAAIVIFREWRPEGAYSLGHVEARLGVLFRFAEMVGAAIRETAKPDDELFVWGDQPSIYIHSRVPCWHPAYLFVYAHYGKAKKAESIVSDLRRNPPRWILFYNWRVHDEWTPEKLSENVPGYREVHRFQVPGEDGLPYVDDMGFVHDFPLLMRDDVFWQTYLFDIASKAVLVSEADVQEATLARAENVFPQAPEIRLRRTCMGLPNEEREEMLVLLLKKTKGADREWLWLLLGEAADNRGDHEEALSRYMACLKEFPLSARALSCAGWQTYALGDHARTLIYWTKAKAIFPELYSPGEFKHLNIND